MRTRHICEQCAVPLRRAPRSFTAGAVRLGVTAFPLVSLGHRFGCRRRPARRRSPLADSAAPCAALRPHTLRRGVPGMKSRGKARRRGGVVMSALLALASQRAVEREACGSKPSPSTGLHRRVLPLLARTRSPRSRDLRGDPSGGRAAAVGRKSGPPFALGRTRRCLESKGAAVTRSSARPTHAFARGRSRSTNLAERADRRPHLASRLGTRGCSRA